MIKLKKIYVEITNDCNLNCSFCTINSRKIEYITKEKFGEILDKIKDNTKHIYLHVLGEPLMHDDLEGLLEVCDLSGIQASITTNATLIEKRSETLKNNNCLRQINYSLQSLFEHNIDKEKIMKSIFNFIVETPSKYHCLRFWNNENVFNDENRKILELIENQFNFKLAEKKDDKIDKVTSLTKGNGIKITQNVFLQLQKKFIWPEVGGEAIFTSGACGGLKHDCAILIDGTVVPCCLDGNGNMPLGNIYKENSLESILQKERAKNIRKGFSELKVKEDFCKTCGFSR